MVTASSGGSEISRQHGVFGTLNTCSQLAARRMHVNEILVLALPIWYSRESCVLRGASVWKAHSDVEFCVEAIIDVDFVELVDVIDVELGWEGKGLVQKGGGIGQSEVVVYLQVPRAWSGQVHPGQVTLSLTRLASTRLAAITQPGPNAPDAHLVRHRKARWLALAPQGSKLSR